LRARRGKSAWKLWFGRSLPDFLSFVKVGAPPHEFLVGFVARGGREEAGNSGDPVAKVVSDEGHPLGKGFWFVGVFGQEVSLVRVGKEGQPEEKKKDRECIHLGLYKGLEGSVNPLSFLFHVFEAVDAFAFVFLF
jgi:hypothetical protein